MDDVQEGPVHDVQWSPSGDHFVTVSGFMPARTNLFSSRCRMLQDLGAGPHNLVRWNPQASPPASEAAADGGNAASRWLFQWDMSCEVSLPIPSGPFKGSIRQKVQSDIVLRHVNLECQARPQVVWLAAGAVPGGRRLWQPAWRHRLLRETGQ